MVKYTSEQRQAWERGLKATWHTTGQGTCCLLPPRCLDASCVGWCAGLVKANGGAEPACKIHFLSIRSLDKSMNLHGKKQRKCLKTTKKEDSRALHLELVPQRGPGKQGQLQAESPTLLASPAVRPWASAHLPEPSHHKPGEQPCLGCLAGVGTKELMGLKVCVALYRLHEACKFSYLQHYFLAPPLALPPNKRRQVVSSLVSGR